MSNCRGRRDLGRVATLLILFVLATTVPAPAKVVFLADGSSPTEFYWFDSDELLLHHWQTFTLAEEVHATAFCPDRVKLSNLIALGKENGVVFELDLATGDEIFLGQLPPDLLGGIVAMVCDRDGRLYLSDQRTEELYTLDLASCQPECAPQLVGTVESSLGAGDIDLEGGDLHIDPDGVLYAVTNNEVENLIRVDKTTALVLDSTTMPAGGWVTGTTWWPGNRIAAASTDDHLYWIDLDDGATGEIGPLTSEGEAMDLEYGDLARPVPFASELQVSLDRETYAPGEKVDYSLFFRQLQVPGDIVEFSSWITDAANTRVSHVKASPAREVEYLQQLTHPSTFTVPGDWAPGTYKLWFRIDGSAQGRLQVYEPFEVTPSAGR